MRKVATHVAEPPAPKPRLHLVALGGTIASASDPEGGGHRPTEGARELLASAPGLADVAELTVSDLARVGSCALTFDHLRDLLADVREAVRGGAQGVVITHGTDTIEETAYALALLLERDVPIVLTGAMRTSSHLGADGPANLAAAVRVAATAAAAELGPVVVAQDEIHLARWVSKVNASRVAAFASPGFGPVGAVIEGRVAVWARPSTADHVAPLEALERRVELIWTALGIDGRLVDAAADTAEGIVVGGMGGGHVPPEAIGALARAVERGIPVVVASRTGAGPMLERTYAGRGSERELRSVGVTGAGTLSPVKARLRLMAALGAGLAVDDVFPVSDVPQGARPRADPPA